MANSENNNQNKNNNNKDNNKRSFQSWGTIILIALILTILFNYVYSIFSTSYLEEISYSEFLTLVEQGAVVEAEFQDDRILILTAEEAEKDLSDQTIYYTGLIPNLNLESLSAQLNAQGVDYSGEVIEETSPIIMILVYYVLPFVIIMLLFNVITRSMSKHMGGGGGVMGIGQSKAKV